MRPYRATLSTHLARILCWVMLLLPLMQTAGVAHELEHLAGKAPAAATVAAAADGTAQLAGSHVCDTCLAFAGIVGGFARPQTLLMLAPADHLAWHAGALPHFAARRIPAYSSRAPPALLA
ncbi:hypothetical protein [Niveibacterium sp. SC-1]|uniref:hypothetical protein n=1 Tax=Niveibacterium sp. SC-1 TaxID=3135646 RepID=UPI00311F58C5